MVVSTNTPEIQKMRRMNLELIFSERNHQCPYCEKSGNCELQALAYRLGMDSVRFPFLWPKLRVDSSHPEVIHDPNRCILCARCVRASAEVDHKGLFAVRGRGIDSDITVNIEGRLGDTNVTATDAAIQVCPTGSLCRRELAYSVRYGERMYDTTPITFMPAPPPPAAPKPAVAQTTSAPERPGATSTAPSPQETPAPTPKPAKRARSKRAK
jgi:[NiFe] hydrogenase diaphorase moiety small subunit